MKLIIIALTVLTGLTSHAADAKKPDAAMMQKFMAASTPGFPHKLLQDMAGDYTFKSKAWHAKGAPAEEGKGSATMSMILGGRWLEINVKGEAAGEMPAFEGRQLVGYDNIKKQYEFMWIDTMSTGAMQGHGKFDAATKTLVDNGTFSCPVTGKDRAYRSEWKMTGAKNLTFALYGTSPLDEKSGEFKMMELTFTRK